MAGPLVPDESLFHFIKRVSLQSSLRTDDVHVIDIHRQHATSSSRRASGQIFARLGKAQSHQDTSSHARQDLLFCILSFCRDSAQFVDQSRAAWDNSASTLSANVASQGCSMPCTKQRRLRPVIESRSATRFAEFSREKHFLLSSSSAFRGQAPFGLAES